MTSSSETNATLLAADDNTRIRFLVSSEHYNTYKLPSPTLSFRAWDQTNACHFPNADPSTCKRNGDTDNVSTNGDSTPYSTDTETATITVNPVSDPPLLNPIGNQLAIQGQSGTVQVVVTDPLDEPVPNILAYTLVPSLPWLTIDSAIGSISMTPTEATTQGLYPVTVSATETDGDPEDPLSVSEEITVMLLPKFNVRHIPLDESFSLDFTDGTDYSGVTFTLSAGPGSITPAGEYTWTPTAAGSYSIEVTATEAGSATAVQTVQLEVGDWVLNATVNAPTYQSVDSVQIPVLSGNGSYNYTALSHVEVAFQEGATGLYAAVDNDRFGAFSEAAPAWLTAQDNLGEARGFTTSPVSLSWHLPLSATRNMAFTPEGRYRVLARLVDNAGHTGTEGEADFTYKSGIRAGTTLSIDYPPSVLHNKSFSVQGWLTPNPDDGQDLSDLPIQLSITGPMEGTPTTVPYTEYTNAGGQYIFYDLPGIGIPGTYSIQAGFDGDDRRGLASSETDPQPFSVGRKAGYALLIQGWTNNLDGLLSHDKTLGRVYDNLIKRGVDGQDIRLLNPHSFSADPIADIQNALQELSASMAGVPAPLYVVLVNHGSTRQFHLDNQLLSAENLNNILGTFETQLEQAGISRGTEPLRHPRMVFLGFCYSGSFIEELSKAPAEQDAGRIIVSSAAIDEVSYKGPKEKPKYGEPPEGVPSGEFFMDALFNYLGQSRPAYSLHEAFVEATRLTEQYTRSSATGTANSASRYGDNALQHPLLDDNGDGTGSNTLSIIPGADGQRAAEMYLGANLESRFNSPFGFTEVTPTLFLKQGETSAELFAEVVDVSRLSSIRADVRKPSTPLQRPISPSSIQLEVNLEGDYLACDTPPRCAWTANLFADTDPGMYEVYYSARNKRGEFAPVKRSVVYKKLPAGQNQAPTAPQLLMPVDNPGAGTCPLPLSNDDDARAEWLNCACPDNICPQTALLFDWSDSTDMQDSFTYTLSIATDEEFNNIVYQAEELEASMYGLSSDAIIDDGRGIDEGLGLKDKTVYYWKVEAIDRYGEKSTSAMFVFMTYNPNAAPSILSGRITDAVTYQTLSDGIITPPQDIDTSKVVQGGGSYLLELPSGNTEYTITAQAPDHFSQSATVVPGLKPVIEVNFALQPAEPVTSLLVLNVVDAMTYQPISNATIEYPEMDGSDVAVGDSGKYLITLPAERHYRITVKAPGYLSQTLEIENNSLSPLLNINIALEPDKPVEPPRAIFEERNGEFFAVFPEVMVYGTAVSAELKLEDLAQWTLVLIKQSLVVKPAPTHPNPSVYDPTMYTSGPGVHIPEIEVGNDIFEAWLKVTPEFKFKLDLEERLPRVVGRVQ